MLEEIKKANYEDVKKRLMKFKGIGEKVADCIFCLLWGVSCGYLDKASN